ncbi:MAG: tape measure protein [Clostridiales bacterium]|nr:tape measure protein [Clostridiales bacterium]
MAADIGNAYINILPSTKGLAGGINSALGAAGMSGGKELGDKTGGGFMKSGFMGAVMGVVSSVTQKAMSVISGSIGDAVSRYDTLQNFPKVMENFGISADVAARVMKEKLSPALQGIPTTMNDAVTAVQNFTAKTGDVDKATDLFIGFNNAVLAGGKSMEEQSSAMYMFTKSFSTGKMDMISWKAMVQAMPAQLDQVAQAMGYGKGGVEKLGDALRSGKEPIDGFTQKIVEMNKTGLEGFPNFAEQAKNATGGVGTNFTNMKTAVTRGLANMLEKIDEAAKANGMPTIAEIISLATDKISAAFSWVQDIIGMVAQKFAEFRDSDAGRQVAKMLEDLTGAAEGFASPGEIFKDIIGKIFDIFLGVGASVIAIVDGVRKGIQDFANSPAGKQLSDTIKDISDKFSALSGVEGPKLTDFLSGLSSVFSGVAQGIGYAVLGIASAVSFAFNLVQNIISGVQTGIETIGRVVQFVKDNIYWLAPVLGTVTALIIAYNAATIAANAAGLVWKATLLGLRLGMLAEAAANIIMTGVKTAYTAVTGFATAATTAFGVALKFAMGPVGLIIIAIGALVTAFIYLWNNSEAFRNFWHGIWNGIKAVASAVINTIKAIIQGFVDFFTGIPGAIENIGGNIVSFFTELPGRIADFFTNLPYMIGYALGTAAGTLARWIVDMATTAAEVGPQIIEAIGTFFAELPGKIWDALTDAFTNFGQWILDMGTKAMEIQWTIIEAIGTFFAELPGEIWDALTDAFTNFSQWITDTALKARDVVPQIIDAIKGFFAQLPGKVLNAISSLWDTIKTTFTSIPNKVSDAIKKIFDVGKDLVKGLWNGITSMGDWLREKITGFASGIIDGFKNAFGTHSPSTVMEKVIGIFIPPGISIGMMKAAPQLLADVRSLSGDITDEFQARLNPALAIGALGDLSGSWDINSTATSGNEKEDLIDYNKLARALSEMPQSVVIDDREFGRIVRSVQ